MHKTILTIVLAALCLYFRAYAQTPVTPPNTPASAKGKVISASTGEPLPGAVINIAPTGQTLITDDNGAFTLNLPVGTYQLTVRYLSYKTQTLTVAIPLKEPLIITLQPNDQSLQEVEIVSTGYQNIPKERATGSFTTIDEKTLNRSVGINILDRLEGVASGLVLNSDLPGPNNPKIAIRGRSTIFANAEPLVVLDGFPYEGTIDQINPADIETINLLKDAAAASIWGTKAGNGVIVITSKKGRKNQKLAIGISSTLTVSDKPDLYYTPQLSSADYIDLEQYLFAKGFYNGALNTGYSAVSPAIEVLNQRKKGEITPADSATAINALKGYDVRNDLEKYAYRKAAYHQYQLNLTGGGESYRYYMSGGYDKNLENSVTNDYSRLTLTARNSYTLLKDKLDITAGISFASDLANSRSGSYMPYTPYDRLSDHNGSSLPVVGTSTLRLSYADTAGAGRLLDWHYRPKDEFIANRTARSDHYRINAAINYKVIDGLSLNAAFQYLKENNGQQTMNDLDSYYTRNLINRYSSIEGNNVIRGIPLGGIVDESGREITSKTIRLQLNYQKRIAINHEINAIAGYEGSDSRVNLNDFRLYGYDPETLSNGNNSIDPTYFYPYYHQSGSAQIPTAPVLGNKTNIAQSFYTNVSYSYKDRYIFSGSARKDESNLFGVKANQKGVPLWSAGLAWIIDKERFYHINWLQSLKLRATFGYNGNVDKSVSGYLTVLKLNGITNDWGNNYSMIINPPNPALRWEKVKTWNFGLDFSLKNNRVSGSVDLYQKNAIDLIGNQPISMQSGIAQFRGNGANLLTKGVDLMLHSVNSTRKLGWKTDLLINYNIEKVNSYKTRQTSNLNIINGNYQNPLEGYPYYAIYSFPSAGLDASGNPQGYLNGEVSKDYSSLTRLLDPDQIKFHGSASPKYFGSMINTFSYNAFELSLNITYKLGYYFRRANVFAGNGTGLTYVLGDYEKRWQNPGDELSTKIPSLLYPNNSQRTDFFKFSEDLVEHGDHIRLRDVRLSYQLANHREFLSLFKSANFFFYAKNLGIIWRKNRLGIDPDYGTSGLPQPLSCSIGLNLTL